MEILYASNEVQSTTEENNQFFNLIDGLKIERCNPNIPINEFCKISFNTIQKKNADYWDWVFNLQKEGFINFVNQTNEFEFSTKHIRLNPTPSGKSNIFQFLEGIPSWISIAMYMGLEESLINRLLLFLKNNYEQSSISQYLKETNELTNFEKFLFITSVGELFTRNKKKIFLSSLKHLISCDNYINFYYKLKNENSLLTKNKVLLVRPVRNEFDLEIDISKKALNIILPGTDDKFENNFSEKNISKENEEKIGYFEGYSIMPHNLINDVPLFLNNQNLKFSHRIKSIIRNKEKKDLSNISLCMMLYGYPGTGKTEFAKQICKDQSLKLMIVEGSEIVNKYIGQTEQNIHNLFIDYKKRWDESETPIVLLFNECDQIFAKKIAVEKSTDIFNNAIQSQLLNELELFKGILICTCNSTDNLEEAFKRRFLFNTKFEKPEESVRYNIWNSMSGYWQNNENLLSELSKFEITGAEIKNVTNKYNLINQYESESNTNLLFELIEEESLYMSGNTKIGF